MMLSERELMFIIISNVYKEGVLRSVGYTVTGKSNGGQFLGCCERNLVYKRK